MPAREVYYCESLYKSVELDKDDLLMFMED